MAKGFSIQHVASTPSGWHVRTVKAGGHRVRVAFPPGRRAKGSGITVEVLHPRNENPLCFKNPAELLLMGGNPIGKKAARERATRIRSARLSNPYDRLSTQEKLAFGRLGLGKAHLRTAADIRRARKKVAEVGRFRNAFPNPGLADVNSPEATEARERSEAFHHREWRDYEVRNEPHTPAGEYSLLGQFLELSVKPTEKSTDDIRQVRLISFPNGKNVRAMSSKGTMVDAEGSDVQVISAADGRPIYLVDDQEMGEEELETFGAGPEDPALIGEARSISYIDEKWHPEAGAARGVKAMYQHNFGDAGGTKPKVFYSRRMKRLLLEGGSYHVEALGITN
jgi:hypothetical protein